MAKNKDYRDWVEQMEKDSGTINVFGLTKETMRKKVSVPPSYLTRLRLAVEQMLQHELYKYNDEIEGAVVSYNPKTLRPVQSATSLHNSPGDAYIHFTVKVDVILFAPKPNMYLTGEVTEITGSYISCLVASIFNCTIPLIDPEGRKIEKDTVCLGCQIRFKVEKIEVDNHGLLVIKGNPNDMSDFEMKRG